MVVRFHCLPIPSFVTSCYEPDVLRLERDPVPVRVEVERLKWQIRTVLGSLVLLVVWFGDLTVVPGSGMVKRPK